MSYIKHDSTHDYDIIGGVCSTSTPDTELPDGSKDKFAKIVVNIPEITEILGEDMTCTNPVQLAQSSKINIWSLNKPFHWATDNNGLVLNFLDFPADFDWRSNDIDDIVEGGVLTYSGKTLDYTSLHADWELYKPKTTDPIYLGDWRLYAHANDRVYYYGNNEREPYHLDGWGISSGTVTGPDGICSVDVQVDFVYEDKSATNFVSSGIASDWSGNEVTDQLGFKYYDEAGFAGLKRILNAWNNIIYLVLWIGGGTSYNLTTSRTTALTQIVKLQKVEEDVTDKEFFIEQVKNVIFGKSLSDTLKADNGKYFFGNDESVRMGVAFCGHFNNSNKWQLVGIPGATTTQTFDFPTSSGTSGADKSCMLSEPAYVCGYITSRNTFYIYELEIQYLQNNMTAPEGYNTLKLYLEVNGSFNEAEVTVSSDADSRPGSYFQELVGTDFLTNVTSRGTYSGNSAIIRITYYYYKNGTENKRINATKEYTNIGYDMELHAN